MQTEPVYLTEPYLRQMSARVLEILPEAAKRFRVLLDTTVFYPMGGGQPTDQGILSWGGATQAKVYQVMMKEGEIWHYLESESVPFEVGQVVLGELDWERRYQNMRVHTGGHLVDFALFRLGFVPEILKPLKGDHGKKPFVLYEGSVVSHAELSPDSLTQAIAELIKEERKLSWEFAPLEKLQSDAIYLQPGLPTHKPLRKLTLDGVGSVADGGTLVRNTAEVGSVTINAIEEKDGQVKVSYQL
ncbi:MAG: alanyl-tRNA editing protein [Chloroflexi bacterium]|uniref:Alanyl-tRNA editing protein n=1 Tax=Candidatus Chlorohelix allophototropha TaxID=3003348 RepID=A0A8T7MAJ0_9CHLR|nr:alanyl-tRNA editing protein [Chloroflexota bacterium]WJW69002.1 alanyl-tRNA editing protein [Chloroflexota bacterium L227-S17]